VVFAQVGLVGPVVELAVDIEDVVEPADFAE
jgi:hypothetical protein